MGRSSGGAVGGAGVQSLLSGVYAGVIPFHSRRRIQPLHSPMMKPRLTVPYRPGGLPSFTFSSTTLVEAEANSLVLQPDGGSGRLLFMAGI